MSMGRRIKMATNYSDKAAAFRQSLKVSPSQMKSSSKSQTNAPKKSSGETHGSSRAKGGQGRSR